jgi:DNA cross-link repair 1A protein
MALPQDVDAIGGRRSRLQRRSRARSPPSLPESWPVAKRPRAAATACPVCGLAPADEAHVNACLDETCASADRAPCPACGLSAASVAHVNACPGAAPPDAPARPPCPVCGKVAADEVHVEACLEDACPPSPPPSPPSLPAALERPIADWLGACLAKHAPALRRGGVQVAGDLLTVPDPADQFLQFECGIGALGPRKKIAHRIHQLQAMPLAARPATAAAPAGRSTAAAAGGAAPRPPVKAARPSAASMLSAPARKAWDIFSASFRANPAAMSRGKPSPGAAAGGAPSGGAGGRSQPRGPRKHALSHRVPGTSFTVDSFKVGHADPCMRFFLTHFHSDHYGGLTKASMRPGAVVLCTAVTASLVRSVLRVPAERIQVLPTGGEDGVAVPDTNDASNGVRVWCFDANHCPGAVVMLFHVRRTRRWVLHSGDCRFDPSLFSRHGKLASVAADGALDFLHLDTTYCDPRYAFPRQRDVLAGVVSAARREDARTGGRCLFFFGAYTVGKERVFLSVAAALDLHIYAGPRKLGILRQLDMPELRARLVDQPADARVHVLPMGRLTPDGVRAHAAAAGMSRKFIGSGLAVVFRPTGWTYRGGGGGGGGDGGVRRTVRGADQAVLYEVAYSEHSSFSELREFVTFARPARILPTVNARTREDADRLCALLGHADRPLRALPG